MSGGFVCVCVCEVVVGFLKVDAVCGVMVPLHFLLKVRHQKIGKARFLLRTGIMKFFVPFKRAVKLGVLSI